MAYLNTSRNSSVDTRLRVYRPRNFGSIPTRSRGFFSPPKRPGWFWAHSAFYTRGTKGPLPSVKQQDCKDKYSLHLLLNLRMSGGTPIRLHGVQSVNFTLTYLTFMGTMSSLARQRFWLYQVQCRVQLDEIVYSVLC